MTLEELMIGDWVRIKSDINSDDAYWMHDNMRGKHSSYSFPKGTVDKRNCC